MLARVRLLTAALVRSSDAAAAAALVGLAVDVGGARRRRHAPARPRSVRPRPPRRRRRDLIQPLARCSSRRGGEDRDGSHPARLARVCVISPSLSLSLEGGGPERGEDVVVELAVRGVQAAEAQVHAGVRVRALLSAGPAGKVRQRAQGVRGQQRLQDAQRAPRGAAGGRRQLAGVRGRGAPPRPRLRLRRLHLRPPAQDQAGARGDRQRAQGALRLHRPGRLRARRPRAAPPRRRRAVRRHGPRPAPAPASADGDAAAAAAAAAVPPADSRGAAHGGRGRGSALGGSGPAAPPPAAAPAARDDDDAPDLRQCPRRRRRGNDSRRASHPGRGLRRHGPLPHPAAATVAFRPDLPHGGAVPAAAVLRPLPR